MTSRGVVSKGNEFMNWIIKRILVYIKDDGDKQRKELEDKFEALVKERLDEKIELIKRDIERKIYSKIIAKNYPIYGAMNRKSVASRLLYFIDVITRVISLIALGLTIAARVSKN